MKKFVNLALVFCFVLASCAAAPAAVEFPRTVEETSDVYAPHAMVSSAHELASKAGVEVMQKGGNAIDAAVATALALNVVEFNASGIGGGGFMTIRFAKTGEVVCLDYRETAPASATKDMYASEESKKERWSIDGGKSVGVPGWLKGMCYALEKYGTMTFAQVAEPAIRLAEEGFELHTSQNGIIADSYDRLVKYNDPDKVAFLEDGLPLEAGKTLRQPNLAKLFRLIGEKGSDAFYTGQVAEDIAAAVNRNGGNMTAADLANYKMAVREPMTGTYRGYSIYSMPPASSGGAHIVQLMNIFEHFDMKGFGHNSPKAVHVMAEAFKLAFADRAKYMADPDFTNVPLAGITSKEYAKTLADKIDLDKPALENITAGDPFAFQEGKAVSYVAGAGPERISTSSFSTVDAEGNVVASTNTINYFCGSGVYVPEWGFLLNDEMDDFSSNPASVNAPEPGKRPLSSMSPTIVLDPEGRAYMSVGAAGATRIFTSVCQIIMNAVDYGMTMNEAIQAPRIHNQLSGGDKAGKLMTEPHMPADKIEFIKARGHEVQEGMHIGTAQGILFDHEKNMMNGGADHRRLGVPVGY